MHDQAQREAVQTALTLANQVSPSGVAQRGFAKLAMDMESAGESFVDICRAIINRMADGMNHGNWPTA